MIYFVSVSHRCWALQMAMSINFSPSSLAEQGKRIPISSFQRNTLRRMRLPWTRPHGGFLRATLPSASPWTRWSWWPGTRLVYSSYNVGKYTYNAGQCIEFLFVMKMFFNFDASLGLCSKETHVCLTLVLRCNLQIIFIITCKLHAMERPHWLQKPSVSVY